MGETSIEWTDYTFNPWWGCQRVSPGCEHCYAETFAKRVGHGKRLPMIWGPPATAERKFFGDAHWDEPRKWNAKAARDGARRRVFCASMADVFEDRPNLKPGYFYEDQLRNERARLWRLIHETPSLDWLLLTKRPENADGLAITAWADAFGYSTNGLEPDPGTCPWLPNIWLGTTVEDQKRADERIPELLRVPARVRFLSCEPLLETVDLSRWLRPKTCQGDPCEGDELGEYCPGHVVPDWIIVGGESGPGARSFDLAWARAIRDQCAVSGVACFVKQMGSYPIWNPEGEQWWKGPHTNGNGSPRFADRKGGDWSEWPEDLRVRQWPEVRQ